jgi:hypothetical protein
MNFERGVDPLKSIGIGLREQIKAYTEDMIEKSGYMLIKHVIRDEWQAQISKHFNLKIKFSIEEKKIVGQRYESILKDQILIVRCKGIEDLKFDIPIIRFFPSVKNITSKTISQKLVSITPTKKPVGSEYYLDSKYKKGNIFRRVWNKIKSI